MLHPGIGLALSQHFMAQGWRVALADINESGGRLGARWRLGTIWRRYSRDQQTKAQFGRVDYEAANARIADMQSMNGKLESARSPLCLHAKGIRVNCVCPADTPTRLAPRELVERLGPERITPIIHVDDLAGVPELCE
ncbi:hypothetical protein AJ80_09754 [Polytolypa hystricis UAMH7299]|uniref:Uncharacterized protein n=1 Tax=Polytolypa hystricis (strain UAMH7299) TaxID=1447883 RepID=A0A2B7WKE8_POLH7|nr:hypothetical protein AJ80_09754 [Polytolypa hystricis UAMH7299]